jgi:hypothetical protein
MPEVGALLRRLRASRMVIPDKSGSRHNVIPQSHRRSLFAVPALPLAINSGSKPALHAISLLIFLLSRSLAAPDEEMRVLTFI